MNIMHVNITLLQNEINAFILNKQADLLLTTEQANHYCKPIVLMNDETYSILQSKMISVAAKNKKEIFDCHIAIAPWLALGEVELR